MIWVIIAAIVVIFIAAAVIRDSRRQHKESKRQTAIVDDYKREEARSKAEFSARLVGYEADLAIDWPVHHVDASGWRSRKYMLMSRDQARLGFLILRWKDDLTEEWSAPIELPSVVSVELQQSQTTIMKLETTGTTTKSGSLGRAAVGGLLFGGAGAIVGAASAGSTTVATTTSTSQTLKGPVYLVIGTTDIERPLRKIEMNSRSEGEVWVHRIRGGLALLAQS